MQINVEIDGGKWQSKWISKLDIFSPERPKILLNSIWFVCFRLKCQLKKKRRTHTVGESEREIVSAMAANKGMLLNFLFAFHLHSIPFDSTKRVNFEMVDVESAGEYVLEIQLHAAPTPKNDVLTRSKETSLHTFNAKKTKWESIGRMEKKSGYSLVPSTESKEEEEGINTHSAAPMLNRDRTIAI